MIQGVKLKICGITSLADAQAVAEIGADYLGFILFPKSPRFVTAEKYGEMRPHLPVLKKVVVCVEPTQSSLAKLADLGFDYFQIHFAVETPPHQVLAWAETVGPERLWLAPKLPPDQDVHPEWLPAAEHFLLDTYHADKFGGTGETGDWAKFKRHQQANPRKTWILSGGLKPDNVVAAIRASGAKFIDVNSGVESSPGVKDPAKLKALAAALRGA
jgi:phosphoribosylanthranilate isomerase